MRISTLYIPVGVYSCPSNMVWIIDSFYAKAAKAERK